MKAMKRISSESSVSEVRQYISSIVGVRGHMPPDWTTVSRWMEKLREDTDKLNEEGVLQMLEMHYKDDFGSKEKLISLPDVQEKAGVSRYNAIKASKEAGVLMQLGGRYCVKESDFQKVFGGK
jgi:hypothetical protein